MNHHNKSVYVIHVMTFMFYTLTSQHRYLEDMLEVSDMKDIEEQKKRNSFLTIRNKNRKYD